MRIDAVLFDLDGTLVDTLDDIADAMDAVLVEAALPQPPRGAYRDYIGEGVRRLVERAAPELDRDTRDGLERRFRAYYAENLIGRSCLYAGVAAVLDWLTEDGTPMAVLSNKPHAMTERVVHALLSDWTFAAVEGHRPERPRKPDPAGALEIAEALELPPARCAFIGDTKTDMQTAVAAGMIPVGALWGFRDRAELEANGARACVATPGELLALVRG